ncbi:hypothetical protein [Rufibacter tibetensis]|uniref:DUF2798 domain-containing protein n=1 Tax=Rufibacter tibetensis TaxID=512763 RepID=A0A0P0CJ86_9BACT|nr:hypothetical protein [Rufibacter tibetensis]ALI99465.1 hypothetical protein DC20_11410 [Rufibacter tibetensis]
MAKVVKRHPFQRDWRRDLLIAALISMLMAMALLLYTFGLTSDFIFRLFNAFFAIFILLAGTAFVIVPGVNWVFMRLSGKRAKTSKPAPRQAAAPKRNLPKPNRTED